MINTKKNSQTAANNKQSTADSLATSHLYEQSQDLLSVVMDLGHLLRSQHTIPKIMANTFKVSFNFKLTSMTTVLQDFLQPMQVTINKK